MSFWPPDIPPNNRDNTTLSDTNHPDDHNDIANALTMIRDRLDPTGYIDVKSEYGARCDAQMVKTGAMSIGSSTLTITETLFTLADQGKTISVAGAGAAGATLVTTILTFNTSTSVTLSTGNLSGSTLSSKVVVWGTDDTTAINNAINALPTAGGTIYLPGVSLCASAVTANGKTGVRFLGTGGINLKIPQSNPSGTGIVGLPPSGMVFTLSGGSTSFCIDARDTFGFQMDQLSVFYTNSAFTGFMVANYGTTSGNPQVYWSYFHNCTFGTIQAGLNTASLFEVVRSWGTTFERCLFIGGNYQVQSTQTGGFTNGLTFSNCSFMDYKSGVLLDPGETTNVSGCSVYRAYDSSYSQMPVKFLVTSGSDTLEGMLVSGTWFSDVDTAPDPPVHAIFTCHPGPNANYGGLTITGCRFSLRATSTLVKITANNFRGLTIKGNIITMVSGAKTIDFGTFTGTRGTISDNTFPSVASATSGTFPAGFHNDMMNVAGDSYTTYTPDVKGTVSDPAFTKAKFGIYSIVYGSNGPMCVGSLGVRQNGGDSVGNGSYYFGLPKVARNFNDASTSDAAVGYAIVGRFLGSDDTVAVAYTQGNGNGITGSNPEYCKLIVGHYESNGTAQVNTGTNSVTVTHKFGVTPNGALWSFSGNTTTSFADASHIWVDTLTSTTFKLNATKSVGGNLSANQGFYWYAFCGGGGIEVNQGYPWQWGGVDDHVIISFNYPCIP